MTTWCLSQQQKPPQNSWITWRGIETLILTRPKGKDSHPKVIFWLPHRCPGTHELVTPHMSQRTHVRSHQTRKGKASKRRKAKKEKWWAASWQMTNVSNLQGEGSECLSMNSTAPLSRAQCLGGTPLDYPNCSHQAWPVSDFSDTVCYCGSNYGFCTDAFLAFDPTQSATTSTVLFFVPLSFALLLYSDSVIYILKRI